MRRAKFVKGKTPAVWETEQTWYPPTTDHNLRQERLARFADLDLQGPKKCWAHPLDLASWKSATYNRRSAERWVPSHTTRSCDRVKSPPTSAWSWSATHVSTGSSPQPGPLAPRLRPSASGSVGGSPGACEACRIAAGRRRPQPDASLRRPVREPSRSNVACPRGARPGSSATSICRSATRRSGGDRKSTRLNSSHHSISYAV